MIVNYNNMHPSLLLKINADVHRQKIIPNLILSAAIQTVYHRLLTEHLSLHHVHYYF